MSERVHSTITVGEYEQLCEAMVMLCSHKGTLSCTVGPTGEYLKPDLNLVNAIDTLRTLKLTLQGREQGAQEVGE
jgi:hypothetical protein